MWKIFENLAIGPGDYSHVGVYMGHDGRLAVYRFKGYIISITFNTFEMPMKL